MKCEVINLDTYNDKNSSLVVVESFKKCPFDIKRIFYIFDVPKGEIRGQHANLNSQFFFIALNGSCEIKIDDGKKQEFVKLERANEGLFLDKMLWKEMFNFSKDCILLVLSNTYYDKNEYVYDYEKYLEFTRGGGVVNKPYLVA